MYKVGSDEAMITFTGLDHRSFEALNTTFKVLFDAYTPHHGKDGIIRRVGNAGRKRLVSASDCLALVLSWTRTRGGMFVLQIIF